MENLRSFEIDEESRQTQKEFQSIKSEEKVLSLKSIFNLLSFLQKEKAKLKILQQQREEYQIEGKCQKRLLEDLYGSLQQLLELIQQQERLFQQNNGVSHDGGQSSSNPNKPAEFSTFPKPVVENARSVFNNGTFEPIQEIIYKIKQDPVFASQIFYFLAEQDPQSSKFLTDKRFIMFFTLLFFDHPFPDCSKTSDINFEYFNLLKCFKKFVENYGSSNLNENQSEKLLSHIMKQIFSGLSKSLEAQCYIKYIFINTFSKINLQQLELFVTEIIQHRKQQASTSLSQSGSQSNREISGSLGDIQSQSSSKVKTMAKQNARSVLSRTPTRAKEDLKKSKLQPIYEEEVKEDYQKQKEKKNVFQKLLGGIKSKLKKTSDVKECQNYHTKSIIIESSLQSNRSRSNSAKRFNGKLSEQLSVPQVVEYSSYEIEKSKSTGKREIDLEQQQRKSSDVTKNYKLEYNDDGDQIQKAESLMLKSIEEVEKSEKIIKVSDQQFQNLLYQRISRLDLLPSQIKLQENFSSKKFDLTQYLLCILSKVIEALFTSVRQVPLSIRLFLKLIAEQLKKINQSNDKSLTYKILNEYFVKQWISQSFYYPEFFGLLPKTMKDKEIYKVVLFQGLVKVFQQTLMMEKITSLQSYQIYYDLVRINEFIEFNQNKVIQFYEDLLDVNLKIFEQNPDSDEIDEKGFMDCVVVRLDDVKMLLKILSNESFQQMFPNEFLSDQFERIENRCPIALLLDEDFGMLRRDSGVDIMMNHFDQRGDINSKMNDQIAPATLQTVEEEFGMAETTMFLIFAKFQTIKLKNELQVLNSTLKQQEADFISQYQELKNNANGTTLILRNLNDFIGLHEVQLNSLYLLMSGNVDQHESTLETIIEQLIKNDDCQSQGRENEIKDRLRIQGLVLLKWMKNCNINKDSRIQAKMIKHLIRKSKLEQSYTQTELNQISFFYENYKNDMQLFQKKIDKEMSHCIRVQHYFDLGNFILTFNPSLCLLFDANYGFSIKQQQYCDKHQTNPLLTGQLLFGIVQTVNPAGGAQGSSNNVRTSRANQNSLMLSSAHQSNNTIAHRTQLSGDSSAMQKQENQSLDYNLTANFSKASKKNKHYKIQKIDHFIIAFQNKFKTQFKEILSLPNSLGKEIKEVDYMNFRKTYEQYLQMIKNALEQSATFNKSPSLVQQTLQDINEYIMRRIYRHLFTATESSIIDYEIVQNIKEKEFTMEMLEFPEELQDENLWVDAIQTFNKFNKEETPMEKLNVLLRTLQICASVFNMASLKSSQYMTADDAQKMLIYVIARSNANEKLYSNYQFIKLFNVRLSEGNALYMGFATLDASIRYIIESNRKNDHRTKSL